MGVPKAKTRPSFTNSQPLGGGAGLASPRPHGHISCTLQPNLPPGEIWKTWAGPQILPSERGCFKVLVFSNEPLKPVLLVIGMIQKEADVVGGENNTALN